MNALIKTNNLKIFLVQHAQKKNKHLLSILRGLDHLRTGTGLLWP